MTIVLQSIGIFFAQFWHYVITIYGNLGMRYFLFTKIWEVHPSTQRRVLTLLV